jgi:hypothetical protein
MANVDIRRNRRRTTVMVVAPVVLLGAFVTHLATSVASGLIILAFLAVRSYL